MEIVSAWFARRHSKCFPACRSCLFACMPYWSHFDISWIYADISTRIVSRLLSPVHFLCSTRSKSCLSMNAIKCPRTLCADAGPCSPIRLWHFRRDFSIQQPIFHCQSKKSVNCKRIDNSTRFLDLCNVTNISDLKLDALTNLQVLFAVESHHLLQVTLAAGRSGITRSLVCSKGSWIFLGLITCTFINADEAQKW